MILLYESSSTGETSFTLLDSIHLLGNQMTGDHQDYSGTIKIEMREKIVFHPKFNHKKTNIFFCTFFAKCQKWTEAINLSLINLAAYASYLIF